MRGTRGWYGLAVSARRGRTMRGLDVVALAWSGAVTFRHLWSLKHSVPGIVGA